MADEQVGRLPVDDGLGSARHHTAFVLQLTRRTEHIEGRTWQNTSTAATCSTTAICVTSETDNSNIVHDA